MQEITFYATANETLATVRDYANAKTAALFLRLLFVKPASACVLTY